MTTQSGATVKEAAPQGMTEEQRAERARLQAQLEEKRKERLKLEEKQRQEAHQKAMPITPPDAHARPHRLYRYDVAYLMTGLLWSISFANTLVCWHSIFKPLDLARWSIVFLVSVVLQVFCTFCQFHFWRKKENPYLVRRGAFFLPSWIGPIAFFIDVAMNFDGAYHVLPVVWSGFPAIQDIYTAFGWGVPVLLGIPLLIMAWCGAVTVAVGPEAGFMHVERR